MILSFKPQFVDPILEGTKIHTLREDRHNRWGIGVFIHFATGVRTKNYNCFMEGHCTGIDVVKIRIKQPYTIDMRNYIITINGKQLTPSAMERLASNDGLSMPAFMRWFDKDFDGKIIYWTRNSNIY